MMESCYICDFASLEVGLCCARFRSFVQVEQFAAVKVIEQFQGFRAVSHLPTPSTVSTKSINKLLMANLCIVWVDGNADNAGTR